MNIEQLFNDNQFLSGGFILMILGSVLASFRKLPKIIWRFIARQFSVTVEIRNDDIFFDYFEKWINDKKGKKLRDVVISRDLSVSPAPGVHTIRYAKKFIRITRTREESSNTGRITAREKFIICFLFCRNIEIARKVLEEIRDEATSKNKKTISIMIGESWFDVWKRDLSTIFLNKDQKDDIVKDISKFITSKDWYDKRGIPWRRGYLLHGPPGNGKTSLARAIASEFNLDLKVIQLGSIIGDSELCIRMSTIVPTVVLIEDIDSYSFAKSEKKKEDKDSVSLIGGITTSGLLNAIDGVTPSEGRILFITTNHSEKLQPALMRAGRVDRKILIDNASREQAEEMFQQFFPSKNGEAAEFAILADGTRSMAELQNMLIKK